MTLLCLLFLAGGGLIALGGGAFLPREKAQGAFETRGADAFDQIVPGMTRAEDLANLGFDIVHGEVLSAREVERRLASDPRRESTVETCLGARLYCTAYLFHAGHAADLMAGVPGLARPDRAADRDIILLIMDGRVIHKVFSPAARQIARASF